MFEHTDGSVTLSRQELVRMAMFMEVPRSLLQRTLEQAGDALSVETLREVVRHHHTLVQSTTSGAPQ